MGKVKCESEVCKFFDIPSIPKKEWNKEESFKRGVAITKLLLGGYAYAACTYDSEKNTEPRITKSFADEPFVRIEKVFVIPNYMETDVTSMDLDDESKKKASMLIQEAKELSEDGTKDKDVEEMKKLPEFVFDHIHNIEEARAFLSDYNRRNKIRGQLPQNEETIKMRLLSIYSQQKERRKK